MDAKISAPMTYLPSSENFPFSPAADRNKQPILERLIAALPRHGNALEIASGTGQHACWFAAAMPGWVWQPSEGDPTALATIDLAVSRTRLPNVRPALPLNVTDAEWLATSHPFEVAFDAIYCANLIHIAPWAACAGLMQGAARHLVTGGVLLTYGPYLEDDVPTSSGNIAFDADLRARDAGWGIRNLADVAAEAERAGLQLRTRHAMPANNLLLEWVRVATPSSGA
jgi:Protein of unknown function (DUF938)